MSDKHLAVEDAFVTTEDRCSHCKSKLANAETARLNWQTEDCRINLRIKQLEQALREAQLVLKMSHQLPIRVDHLRWWLNQRDKVMETIKSVMGDDQ